MGSVIIGKGFIEEGLIRCHRIRAQKFAMSQEFKNYLHDSLGQDVLTLLRLFSGKFNTKEAWCINELNRTWSAIAAVTPENKEMRLKI
jgi:hypothetical protein